jgi:hypothetical protein
MTDRPPIALEIAADGDPELGEREIDDHHPGVEIVGPPATSPDRCGRVGDPSRRVRDDDRPGDVSQA